MRHLLLTLSLFLSLGMLADHHKKSDENAKNGPKNPNHLMTFKQCKETKDGVGGLLSLADKTWREIEDMLLSVGFSVIQPFWRNHAFVGAIAIK